MDPEAVLDKLRETIAEYRKWSGHACDQRALDEADKMADLFEVLDRWLSQGGFLPEDWKKGLR